MVFFHGDSQVEKADVINSYLFGQTVIPISDDDKSSMALKTEKCCQILGFTKRTNVPRHMLLGDSVMYIAPKHDVKPSIKAINALVKALLDIDMVAIVRKVYRKNCAPQIGVLIPTCEEESYFFYYTSLPFAEDERFTRLPSLNNVKPSQKKLDAVDQLIDAFDLSQFEGDDDPYSKFINPSVEHLNSMIVLKALNPTTPLPSEPSEAIANLLNPKLEILESALGALENVKSQFPLEEIEQKSYRKGAADIFNRDSANDDPVDILDIKSENLADSMASFVQSTVTEIGTVDPEGNFLKLLEKGEPFNKLNDQMQISIKKLFLTSSNTVGFKKPLSALSLLRTYCIIHNPLEYNSFVASLKDDLVERNFNDCWDKIVQDKLGLITSEEAQESSVSVEEAKIFYEIKKCESQSEINYEMEAEDMIDMI